MRFIDKMKEDKLTLVVSCPVNDFKFAKAAWENGADAVKIHLNVNHHASGNHYGSLEEELEFVEKLLKESPVPVGVVVGGDLGVVKADFKNVLTKDFDFLSLYAHDATTEVINQNKITRMLACNNEYSLKEIAELSKQDIDILEVSVMNQNDYGKPLSVKDLVTYRNISDVVNIPMLLPTQKKVEVSDLKNIKDAGFSGIMIGAVVTSKDFDTYVSKIKQFKDGIDQL